MTKTSIKTVDKRHVVILFALVAVPASMPLGAAIGASWRRSEVTPVVLVKPGIGGFEPVEGSSIGNSWSKSEVKPVLLLKPGIGGFEPREGSSIGNTWSKGDVLAVMLVEPAGGAFVPLGMLASGHDAEGTPSVSTTSRRADSSQPATIESQVGGEFKGWEGETIVKLSNGQIWQQSEYFYHYHYAFMPKVLIFKAGGGYKMKVDGVEKAIGVRKLK